MGDSQLYTTGEAKSTPHRVTQRWPQLLRQHKQVKRFRSLCAHGVVGSGKGEFHSGVSSPLGVAWQEDAQCFPSEIWPRQSELYTAHCVKDGHRGRFGLNVRSPTLATQRYRWRNLTALPEQRVLKHTYMVAHPWPQVSQNAGRGSFSRSP